MEKPDAKKELLQFLQDFIDSCNWKPRTPTPEEIINEDQQEMCHVVMCSFAKKYHNYMIRKLLEAKEKYYFVFTMYQAYGSGEWAPQTAAIDIHPIEWAANLNKSVDNYETRVCSWQEISKMEYELYHNSEDFPPVFDNLK